MAPAPYVPVSRRSRVVPEVPDDAEVFADVVSMRKLMQAMSKAAKRKASHDVKARNRAAREQVRHEEVMRQVQKTFADQDEYVRRAEARQRSAEQRAWRRRQREEQRERQLRRARGGSLPDIHAAPAPAPEEAAAPRSPPPPPPPPAPAAAPGAFAEGFAPPGAAKGRRRFDVGAPRARAPGDASARRARAARRSLVRASADARGTRARSTSGRSHASAAQALPSRTCATCGRKFPSLMHLLMHDAAGCGGGTKPVGYRRRRGPGAAGGDGAGGAADARRPRRASDAGPPKRRAAAAAGGAARPRAPGAAPAPARPTSSSEAAPGRGPRGRGGPGDDDDDGDDAFFERATGGAWDEWQKRREPPPRAGRGYGGFDARFPKAPSPPPTPPRAETLYDVLGVDPDATDAHLRRRYKALALRHHPDRTETTRETTELMARINGAYETLCDPETRATYDATALAT